MRTAFLYCPQGHIAHLEHDGTFSNSSLWVVCSPCKWRSAECGSEAEAERLCAEHVAAIEAEAQRAAA